MDARKTAGSKSKSTISDLLLSETARQTACQLAPQKRPNGFKTLPGFWWCRFGVAGLGSINLAAPPSRRPKDYAPSPSHHNAADPQTPQTPQPPLKAANISKRPQSNSKKPPHRIGRHQIDIDKRGWPIRKS
jgi:hypothetical protein